MSTFLSKLLPLFIYPLGLSVILLIAALILAKKPRITRILLIFAVLILWLGSTRWVAFGLARSLEWRYFPPQHIPKSEVIVVLGGATEAEHYPRPSVEVNSAADRLFYAAQLYHQGSAPFILLTGGRIPWISPVNQDSSPAHEMAALLEIMGIPAGDIWLESESHNTYDNAVYSREILESKGLTDILLVTSASHMPRAVKLFEAQGFNVTPMPADYTVTRESWDQLTHGSVKSQILNLIPGANDLSLTTRMLKEYVGMVYYTLRGWQ